MSQILAKTRQLAKGNDSFVVVVVVVVAVKSSEMWVAFLAFVQICQSSVKVCFFYREHVASTLSDLLHSHNIFARSVKFTI